MTEQDEPNPMTEFLAEASAEGKVAYSPSSEIDTGRHWIFNRENAGFNFNFVVHDRDGVLGYEVYAKDIQWVGRFLYPRNFQYVDELCEEVSELVEDAVEIREEPMDIGTMETYCSGCHTHYEVDVMPKMDLVIHGVPAQRLYVETCPDCGEDLIEKKTYDAEETSYPEDASELEETRLWEHSRRTL